LFYVIHYFDNFKNNLPSVFAIWQGGLELLGGVVVAVTIIFIYLWYHKLPIRRYLDILAIGLMLALVFGRIGCFLNGCCYGKPTELPWAVRFPYNSFAYVSQINADLERKRAEPHLILPQKDYLGFTGSNGQWYPKPYEDLTEKQKIEVTEGKYRCLPVHPTQLYSSATAIFCCLLLYLFWRRAQKTERQKSSNKLFIKPGSTFALMFIVYGIIRFSLEFLRDDNPFEFDSLTISQNIAIAMIALGVVLMTIFQRIKSKGFKS
ncbi:MAG: prolipoprotein diacylglyceryl transferase, partial [Planctomycetota bacterium]|jgi:phosphatidylglycerol:prolipoprotein diacylglycerol transferase